MSHTVHITSFYRFVTLEPGQVEAVRLGLENLAAAEDLRGLCLLGAEGINATLSGSFNSLARVKAWLATALELSPSDYKNSVAPKHPFHVFKVKIKDEIVTLGRPGLAPTEKTAFHLSPADWEAGLSDPNTVVIDTRNDYEVAIGKFKGAVDFGTEEFSEFPERMRASGIAKDKNIFIYCTGGIRCEKAALALNEDGYKNVYQLDGGILNYLEQFPRRSFDGECFVFDYRVAVDQDLKPSTAYKPCPHCGQPASQEIDCRQCSTAAVVCEDCSPKLPVCSKNCAHHLSIGSASTKPHKQELDKRRLRDLE